MLHFCISSISKAKIVFTRFSSVSIYQIEFTNFCIAYPKLIWNSNHKEIKHMKIFNIKIVNFRVN